jgi:hypothetical protein
VSPIVGMPTVEALKTLQLTLNANAASVQCNLGNGLLGLLALTVSNAVYTTFSNIPFVVPINPGPTAIIPEGHPTAVVIANGHHLHTKSSTLFLE